MIELLRCLFRLFQHLSVLALTFFGTSLDMSASTIPSAPCLSHKFLSSGVWLRYSLLSFGVISRFIWTLPPSHKNIFWRWLTLSALIISRSHSPFMPLAPSSLGRRQNFFSLMPTAFILYMLKLVQDIWPIYSGWKSTCRCPVWKRSTLWYHILRALASTEILLPSTKTSILSPQFVIWMWSIGTSGTLQDSPP